MNRIVIALALVGCGKGDKGIENLPSGSRIPEVVHRLDAIAKKANAIFRETKAFPTGTSATLPERNGRLIAGGCCGGMSGSEIVNKCPVSTTWASDPVWKTLAFTIDTPEMYRYAYTSTDGKSFILTATGDADCDEREAVFTVRGTIDASNEPKAVLELPPKGMY
jgi:hypothetical protein